MYGKKKASRGSRPSTAGSKATGAIKRLGDGGHAGGGYGGGFGGAMGGGKKGGYHRKGVR